MLYFEIPLLPLPVAIMYPNLFCKKKKAGNSILGIPILCSLKMCVWSMNWSSGHEKRIDVYPALAHYPLIHFNTLLDLWLLLLAQLFILW